MLVDGGQHFALPPTYNSYHPWYHIWSYSNPYNTHEEGHHVESLTEFWMAAGDCCGQ